METKTRIEDIFRQLVANDGLEKVRISEICRLLGIERKLFYYYFDDKYALLKSIYVSDLQTNFNLEATTKENWSDRAAALLQRYRMQATFYRQAIEADDHLWEREFLKHMRQLFEQLFAELAVNSKANVEFHANFYAGGWTETIEQWMLTGFQTDETALVARFDELIDFTKTNIAHWQ